MTETDIWGTGLRNRLVALTQQLMLIRTTEFEPGERRRCIDFIRNHLEDLPGVELREYGRNGEVSLVVNTEGCREPEILMCGHIDVVAHPDDAAYRTDLRDGRIVGPGAGDMKGAVAIMLEVFREVVALRPSASLGIAITSDEEKGGADGVGYLFGEAGLRCGLALVPDGGCLNRVTVREKGILHLDVRCSGTAGHAARPWLADNASERLLGALCRLRGHFDETYPLAGDQWQPSCAITILGTPNRTVNRVPGHAHAGVDIRFPHPHTARGMLEEVRAALGRDVEVEPLISAEPADFAPDPEFLRIVEEITGEPVAEESGHGGSDARFVAAAGIPAVLSRPLVGDLHSVDEWIDVGSMVTLYRIYREYIVSKLG